MLSILIYICIKKDDAFRLTIDKIFPSQKPEATEQLSEFAVPGYNHTDNLWELLGKIGR